jgi:hypothetical protein
MTMEQELTASLESKGYAIYVIAFLIPTIFISTYFALKQWDKKNSILTQFSWSDFLSIGFIAGFVVLFAGTVLHILHKFKAKIELDTMSSGKTEERVDLMENNKKITYFFILSFVLGLCAVGGYVGMAYTNTLLFENYERKIAPPGVGPGISQSYSFDYS